ncbi:excitatory amino acid transporter-like [Haliotis rufescens]|uniref:excitatory amino acid transporter-like n=1 Tax=Haliotis rufescens TaxID=6454 RepID=UPI001EB033B9|nr:excitatory amino acid transporter-like [Haliotis rufescens]
MELQNLTADPFKGEPSRKSAFLFKVKLFVRRDALLLLTIAGIVVGFGVGFGVRELHPSKDALMWIGMPGELFLRMLRMMILPLIVCSVISGTASLDPKSNGKVSAIAFAFIVATNSLVCIEAIALHFIIQPGAEELSIDESATREIMETQDIFADMLRNIVPDNLVEATFRQAQTRYASSLTGVARNNTNTSVGDALTHVTKSLGKTDSVNVLGLITACTIIGMAASALKDKADVFLKFFSAATEIVLLILRKFFWVAPLGIGSLIAVSVAGVSNITGTFSQLGMFVVAVTVGILFHSFVVLPAILFALTRRNPYAYLLTIIRPCLIGFASTSTAVAIPEMLESCEVKNGIDSRVSRFVIPFSVTLNADGSALYITSAALFIANLSGVEVTTGVVAIIGVLTAVAAMAIPSVPSSSIVTLFIILTSANIPVDHIALLFAVEWFLDRIRTPTNIVSHTFNAAVTYRFCKADLRALDEARTKEEEAEITSISPA